MSCNQSYYQKESLTFKKSLSCYSLNNLQQRGSLCFDSQHSIWPDTHRHTQSFIHSMFILLLRAKSVLWFWEIWWSRFHWIHDWIIKAESSLGGPHTYLQPISHTHSAFMVLQHCCHNLGRQCNKTEMLLRHFSNRSIAHPHQDVQTRVLHSAKNTHSGFRCKLALFQRWNNVIGFHVCVWERMCAQILLS